ncbi:MAG: hypothetical protein M0C28_47045, partial [Candidatus Moduliflexus flocculans]|nr:hypothetical protein [Candidatus Moduliflexus flocculans]
MMPALWGNARLLCGLVEAARAFPARHGHLPAPPRRLGDFYVARSAALQRSRPHGRVHRRRLPMPPGYVTCWFPGDGGPGEAPYDLTGERKYLEAAVGHGGVLPAGSTACPSTTPTVCSATRCRLLLLYEATRDVPITWNGSRRAGRNWCGAAISTRPGGILEKCQVQFARDEGCAIADWLRLNLALGPRHRQGALLGHGRAHPAQSFPAEPDRLRAASVTAICSATRTASTDLENRSRKPPGAAPSTASLVSSTCARICWRAVRRTLTCNFALDFTAKDGAGTTASVMRPGLRAGEVLAPARARWPASPRPSSGYASRSGLTRSPRSIRRELRCPSRPRTAGTRRRDLCATWSSCIPGASTPRTGTAQRLAGGPRAGQPFVLGYGPKLLAAEGRTVDALKWPTTLADLEAPGLRPFPVEFRNKGLLLCLRSRRMMRLASRTEPPGEKSPPSGCGLRVDHAASSTWGRTADYLAPDNPTRRSARMIGTLSAAAGLFVFAPAAGAAEIHVTVD